MLPLMAPPDITLFDADALIDYFSHCHYAAKRHAYKALRRLRAVDADAVTLLMRAMPCLCRRECSAQAAQDNTMMLHRLLHFFVSPPSSPSFHNQNPTQRLQLVTT